MLTEILAEKSILFSRTRSKKDTNLDIISTSETILPDRNYRRKQYKYMDNNTEFQYKSMIIMNKFTKINE